MTSVVEVLVFDQTKNEAFDFVIQENFLKLVDDTWYSSNSILNSLQHLGNFRNKACWDDITIPESHLFVMHSFEYLKSSFDEDLDEIRSFKFFTAVMMRKYQFSGVDGFSQITITKQTSDKLNVCLTLEDTFDYNKIKKPSIQLVVNNSI